MSNESRRFTEEEFALVLRKAMSLHDRTPRRHGLSSQGMTLEDMKAVASEVGIDPALVDHAVALLPKEENRLKDRILGGPTRYRLEHTGHRLLSSDETAGVIDVIRRELQHVGRVTSELNGVAWETVNEVSQFHVSVAPRGENTEVRLTVNRDGAFILTWFLSVAGGLVAAGITGGILEPESAVVGAGLVAAGAAGGLALARTLWGRTTRSIRAKIDRLMEAMVGEIGFGERGGDE